MSSGPSPPHDRELEIARLIDGDLGELEAMELAELMETDSDLRKSYLQHVAMQAMLQWRHGVGGEQVLRGIDPATIRELLEEAQEVAQHRAAEEYSKQAKREAERSLLRRQIEVNQQRRANRRPKPIIIPWSVVYAAVGTIAAAAVMLVYSFWPQPDPSRIAEEKPVPMAAPAVLQVATIIGSMESQWSDPGLSSSPGTRLAEGPLELVHGFVEIVFDDGAKAVIESPAKIELLSKNRLRITRGKLVGNVPNSAIGFTAETPLATIVDLGTEFGIAIDDQDSADVSVFVGKVEAVVGDSDQRVSLTKDRSIRVALVDGRAEITEVPNDPNLFVRKLPDVPAYVSAVRDAKPFIYWRFEASAGGFMPNEMSDSFQGTIHRGDAGATGLENGVMAFAPTNPGLVVACDNPPEVPIPDDFSIEFWMKPNKEHRGAIVSLGVPSGEPQKPTHSGILIEVCGRTGLPNERRDTVNRPGFLRFLHRSPPDHTGGISCYSEQPYKTRSWQHVAAVKEGSDMLLYINGQLLGRADDPSSPPKGLRLQVGQLYAGQPIERSFDGRIDELAIYDRALSQGEVREHFGCDHPISRLGGAN